MEVTSLVVRGVRLERRGSSLQVISSVEIPWSKTPGGGLLDALVSAHRALGRGPAIVGLPTSAAIVTTVNPLIVNPQRASLAIEFELQQQLPYDVNQAVWHYQWLANGHPSGQQSPRAKPSAPVSVAPRQAVVVAMKDAVLEEHLQVFRRTGFSIEAVGLTGVAAANLWLRQQDRPRHGAILHANEGLLEWIIIRPSWLQIQPVVASEDLAYDAVLESLRESWDRVREGGGGAPEVVWLAGDADLLLRLQEDLKRLLPCATERLVPTPTVTMDSGVVQDPPKFAVACGLALQGFRQAPLSLNFLIERRHLQRSQRIRRIAVGVNLVSVALTLILGAMGMLTTFQRRQEILQHLADQEHLYKMLRPEVRALMEQQQRQERWLDQLTVLRQHHGTIGRIVHELGQFLPQELWLTSLELAKGSQLSGTLSGHAGSFQAVTQLMDNLKGHGWIDVKPLATTVTTDPATGKELVVFTIQGQVPLVKPSAAVPERKDER